MTSEQQTTEDELMITMRFADWLRMDGEIKRLRAALEDVIAATDVGAYLTARHTARIAIDGSADELADRLASSAE